MQPGDGRAVLASQRRDPDRVVRVRDGAGRRASSMGDGTASISATVAVAFCALTSHGVASRGARMRTASAGGQPRSTSSRSAWRS